MTIRTVDATEWIRRLRADKDGSEHMEWLYHEEPLLGSKAGNLASQECNWDGSRADVWAVFDKNRLPKGMFIQWPGAQLPVDGTWLLELADKTAQFDGSTYPWVHALLHGDLESILMATTLDGAPQNMPPPWVMERTIMKIVEQPELADSLTVPVTSLMAVLRHNDRKKLNGQMLHELLMRHSVKSAALKAIIDFYEDDDTDLGTVGDMHEAFAQFFPLCGYILLLGDDDLSEDAADMIDRWPAEVKTAVEIGTSVGVPANTAAKKAWSNYRDVTSTGIALPSLDVKEG